MSHFWVTLILSGFLLLDIGILCLFTSFTHSPFCPVSHSLCIDVLYRRVVHSCQNELPHLEQVPCPMALGSSCQKEWQRQLRREGLVDAGVIKWFSPLLPTCPILPTGFGVILLPFNCTLLFAHDGISGNTPTRFVPYQTSW